MKAYKGICNDCGLEKWISNARCLCSECVYKANHEGKTRLEVTQEKQKNRTGIKVYKLERKPLKRSKTSKRSKESIERRQKVLDKDRETYLQVFNDRPDKCEECGAPLPPLFDDEEIGIIYISQYSHILSKGSHPEHRHNPKNFNRLCHEHHNQWEFGDRLTMKIYLPNQKIIEELFKSSFL